MKINRCNWIISFVMLSLIVISTTALAEPLKLSEGTLIHLKTVKELVAGKTPEGERIDFEVMEDVTNSRGDVLIKAGAKAIGKVTASKGSGSFGKTGQIDFTIEEAVAADNSIVPLRTTYKKEKDNSKTISINGKKAMVVGSLFRGKSIVIKTGTEFVAYVDEDISVNQEPEKPVVPVQVVVTAPPASPVTTVPVKDEQPAQPSSDQQPSQPPSDSASKPAEQPQPSLKLLSNYLAGSNVIGEIINEGKDPCSAEIIALIKKEDKVTGAGAITIDRLTSSEKRTFSIPITGSTDGLLSVDVNSKMISSTDKK